MRFVQRQLVPVPLALQQVPPEEIEAIRGGAKAKDRIYAADDVKKVLAALYYGKCAFCEVHVGQNGVVEHFHPWRTNPELSYEWSNLNLCCKSCNDEKRSNKYKTPDKIKTALIDPSAQKPDLDVQSILCFESDMSVTVITGNTAEEAINTSHFLSRDSVVRARLIRRTALLDVIIESTRSCESLLARWGTFCNQEVPIMPTEESERAGTLCALEIAHKIFDRFLTSRSEFSVALGVAVLHTTHLSVSDFARMSEAWLDFRNRKIEQSPPI